MNSDTSYSYMRTYDGLVSEVKRLGFPEDFGRMIAKNLGSPKAMYRMTVYLENVRPHSGEEIADEMLAIMEDRNRWAKKKEAEEINSRYNEYLNQEEKNWN